MRVFVYGTLLQGFERHDVLMHSDYLGPALLAGAALYDAGAYPGMREASGEMVGEVYDVSDETLTQLDEIEGYDPGQPDVSLFCRKPVTVRWFADGSRADVAAYFHGAAIRDETCIRHGDYRRHLLEQSQGRQWVLSFGSNLSSPRLEARVGQWPDVLVGWLPGYELVFNKTGADDNVFANVRYTGEGYCPAVAYALTPEQTVQLDPYEAGYLRIGIPFETETGGQIVQMYLTHPDELVTENRPPAWYQTHLEAGYEEHELDWTCLEEALGRTT